ncbi:MAG: GDSL-type esterase/lipase family protein [Methylotenera sp.]|nr:GDSL-type esterase/lipase family protein [Methylotenera sp.]MDP1754855.1 GDSL-type esterase/lipase family protein [Methylotenera sp.]MDP1958170.1 GDSL-type esterase/lipase family protein [Methylotenera sp.]MDP3304156.1 GDSL-type esterase/lipase family protein [Methylotenera sp.]MDP3943099.1 GDSL-type esterase/lipase family protein [Methylotenera sp.]
MLSRLFIVVWVLISVAGCGSTQQYTVLPANASVVILGDSLTYGTGAGLGEDYASILATNTHWNVINAGVPGNTSANGLARLPELLAEHDTGEQKIDLLIVVLGGNDFLKHVAETETVNNLKAILTQAKAKNIQTVLLAIPKFSPVGAAFGNLSDHPLYEKIAQETGAPLVADVFSEVLAKNSLKADPIHPNAEGYRIVESQLRSALVKLGFLTS